MDISIAGPVYNKAKNICGLFKSLKKALGKINKTYEIIFVDDGSKDNSVKILKDLRRY